MRKTIKKVVERVTKRKNVCAECKGELHGVSTRKDGTVICADCANK